MIFDTDTKLTKRMYCSIDFDKYRDKELGKNMYSRVVRFKEQFLAIYSNRCIFTYPVK